MVKNYEIYWTKKDGTSVLIDAMSIGHVKNTLKMILRYRQGLCILSEFTSHPTKYYWPISSSNATDVDAASIEELRHALKVEVSNMAKMQELQNTVKQKIITLVKEVPNGEI